MIRPMPGGMIGVTTAAQAVIDGAANAGSSMQTAAIDVDAALRDVVTALTDTDAVGAAQVFLEVREGDATSAVRSVARAITAATGAMTAFAWWHQPTSGGVAEWAAFAYLAVVSMYLGFFAWYRGLAIGPMSSVSQVQLVQPVLTICWAAILLHEGLTWPVVVGGAAVIVCATVAVRTRMSPSVRQEELSS